MSKYKVYKAIIAICIILAGILIHINYNVKEKIVSNREKLKFAEKIDNAIDSFDRIR